MVDEPASNAGTGATTRATAWPDLAGRLIEGPDGRAHVLPVRVYFEDTDFSDPPLL